jgi:NADPH:quinone reductase
MDQTHVEQSLPHKFHGLVLHKPNELEYEEISYDFDNLDKDYVVIEVKATGLGPYDLGFVIGRLQTGLSHPTNIGVEGSGIVVKIGSNVSQDLLNKRVAFLSNLHDPKEIHAYSQYAVINKDMIVTLPDSIDYNQGAYLLANPLTVKCLYDDIIRKHKSIVLDVAASSLGKMINKIAKKQEIKVINIVRRDESVEILKTHGSEIVFNQNSPTFFQDFSKASKEIKPSLYITCLGGGFPSRIIDLMPNDSVMCCLGNITNEALSGYSSMDFIFKGKSIIGFQLFNYLKDRNEEEKRKIFDSVIESLSKGEEFYTTDIVEEFKFEQWEEARQKYEKDMSKGKIILKP